MKGLAPAPTTTSSGAHGDAARARDVLRDCLAQLGDAGRGRVAVLAAADGGHGRVLDVHRRGEVGLADAEGDDVLAGGLQLGHFGEDDEGVFGAELVGPAADGGHGGVPSFRRAGVSPRSPSMLRHVAPPLAGRHPAALVFWSRRDLKATETTMAAKKKRAKATAAPKRSRAKAEGEVLADAKEQAQIEQYWHRAGRTKPRKPPGNYKYVEELAHLQVELIKLQEWVRMQGLKVAVIFEGRDAAGKGGVIKRIAECLNPRICRIVALGTPTERERGQWYFQRYVAAPARAGRDRPLRPQLVQPRRRRARHGLLHRGRVRGVPALLPAVRGDAGALRHLPRQVLVLGERRGAGAALPGAHPQPHQALEALPRWTSSRASTGSSTRAPRT